MATLVLLQGGEAKPYPIASGRVVLGRQPDCDIQLDSNMVSRKHAELIADGDSFILNDLGSGNGSYINGKRITEQTVLKNQDRIKLGPMLFRFETGEATQLAPSIADATGGFDVAFDDADESSTIVGSVDNASGFGMLDVRPDAKLKAVIEISRSLAGTVDVEKLLPRILDTLFGIFPHADRGCILLSGESGDMKPAAQKHRRQDEDSTVKLSSTILKKVLNEKTGVLSADAASDDQFEASESISNLSIRSMMCVPMLGLDGSPLGVINIDTQNPLNQFKNEDLDLLLAIAGQAALSYESAKLMASFMAKQKQDNELEIARKVQQALLPEQLPQADGYEFFASYDSAQAVGGDYYDAMQLSNGKICLSFGDVAGKGVPGALIMSRMSSCVQNTMSFVHEVEPAVTTINNHMCDNAVEGRFVTYVLVILDVENHEMSLINAGHMSPLIRRPDGTVDEFEEDTIGIPIGVMEDYPYETVSRKIEPGETVVLITDGVDEAMNPAGELYEKERVRDFVSKSTPKAEELGTTLLADVRRHADGRPQNDDITIMTFGRNPE